MGRRKWKQYQDLVLKTPLKLDTEDWEPQDKCCMCDGRAFLDSATSPAASDSGSTGSNSQGSSSLRETPPVTLPHEGGHSTGAPNNVIPSLSKSTSGMTTLQSVTSMAASLAAVAALGSNMSNSGSGPVTNIPGVPTPPGAMPFYPPPPHHHGGLFPHWYLSPPHSHLAGRTVPSPTVALADGLRLEAVPSVKRELSTTPPIVMALPPTSSTSEQPLDLSAKAVACASDSARDCNPGATPSDQQQSLKVPNIDNKHIFKAKPRMSTVAGRRTYTEEELQAALRDIQSGKLGTRRAAVIYGIPRSTLRNKVYKLALERERDSHLVLTNNTATVGQGAETPIVPKTEPLHDEEDEKELSGAEEEREVEKALRKPLLSLEDLVRLSVFGAGKGLIASDPLRTLLQHGRFLEDGLHRHATVNEDGEDGSSPSVFPGFPQNILDIWGGMEHSALGPYISQFLANSAAECSRDTVAGIVGSKNVGGGTSTPEDKSPIRGDFLPKFPMPLLPEFVQRMMAEDNKLLLEEQMKKHHHLKHNFHPNGAHSNETTGGDPEKYAVRHSTVATEESPDAEACSSSGATPPSNVILKIPSFKPTSKNGVAPGSGGSAADPQESSSQQFVRGSDSSSPPTIPPSLTGKGIGVSLREVIAKSISQKFQQHGSGDVSRLQLPSKLLLAHDAVIEPPFKRGRFTPPLGANSPSVTASVIKQHNNNNTHSDDRNAQKMLSQVAGKSVGSSSGVNNAGNPSGGKGTRPKRGKYRNYDRDSLIEAVRAVQRGEMSVHRAGSHFGVPHSTLEYKVKERHLMRPRKREPKPHMDDTKKKDDNNILRHSAPTLEKHKIPAKPIPKTPFTPTSGIPNAPNGLKIPPMFDPANMPPMPYAAAPPFPFWTPSPFHSLPIADFPRNGANNTPVNYSPSPEFFASQMMQRLQEESSRVNAGGGDASSPMGVSTSSSRSPPLSNPGGALGKSAREMAESLYDGTGANGSFLDGIIRSSLEMGLPPGTSKEASSSSAPENMSNKALLDQLCRNSRLTPLPRAVSLPLTDGGASSSDDDSMKPSLSKNERGHCGIKTAATESDASASAIIDLSPLSNGSTADRDFHRKHTAEDEGDDDDDDDTSSSSEEDTKVAATLFASTHVSESQKEETNGICKDDKKGTDGDNNVVTDDDVNDESACDSKNIIKRVDKDAAKDDKQGEGGGEDPLEKEDTKSNINSLRD
ncbi:mushroom body large-type Kenyon cell-specific protein 1 isoform X2 [Zootermopsis nevadensis]|nr:mushroom body large-type Kenyon cell-specific protein 1 isoform X2 [Zootermopsis nevadensis]XP_021914484.1 mushroom body large-type Kenyon cell-specific protein 1 isoform X2 [Zootermopsis nevadensis]XP_021914485.1 mushroom body large-type Kenyon cell-specific protein 1 isoform X2 [Zootermopsis nevadensis]